MYYLRDHPSIVRGLDQMVSCLRYGRGFPRYERSERGTVRTKFALLAKKSWFAEQVEPPGNSSNIIIFNEGLATRAIERARAELAAAIGSSKDP